MLKEYISGKNDEIYSTLSSPYHSYFVPLAEKKKEW
jgi:hypothetical protein